MKKIFSFLAAALFAGSMMAETATLKYSGATTTNMEGDGANNAAVVNLDASLFTVLADKGSASNNIGLNKAGNIRLYTEKNSGDGNILTVSIAEGSINFIALDILQDADKVVKADGKAVTESDGKYTINATSFSIQNVTTGATTQLQLKSITIDYTAVAAAVEKPVISPEKATFFDLVEVSLTCATEGAEIHYTLNGDEPDAKAPLYEAPFEVKETTTVKAIAIKGEDKSKVVEKTFTKIEIWTVAKAHQELAENSPIQNACVKGIISQIDSMNDKYGSITYWISDDGSTKDQLQVYGGLGLNGNKFDAITDLELGDKVVVFGNLKVYNSTDEFDKDNILISLEKPAPTAISNTELGHKAVKTIENGMIVIEKAGVKYNVLGQTIR